MMSRLRAGPWWEHGAFLLAALAVAVVARWPVSIFTDALQLDANVPLHALVARDLTRGGSLTALVGVEFPDGVPGRFIALPLLALATPLNLIVGAIPALNLAVLLWVALQGVSAQLLGKALGWSVSGRAFALVAVELLPAALLASGNGQFENIAYLQMALAVFAGTRPGWRGAGLAGVSALLAVFSSPYQAIVAGLLYGSVALSHGWRRLPAGLAAVGLAWALAFAYYLPVRDGALHLLTKPAESSRAEPAALREMVVPAQHRQAEIGALPGPSARVAALGVLPRRGVYDDNWPWSMPVVASYLGVALLFFGGVGLARRRRDPTVRGLVLGGLACLVLALGAKLHLSAGNPSGLPLPWGLSPMLPGVSGMQATWRFLSGVGFALALCGAAGLTRARWAALACALVAADSLLLAPANWPLAARAPHVETVNARISDGPVILWPGPPALSPERLVLFGLAVDRPIALFVGSADKTAANRRVDPGLATSLPLRNRFGELRAEWVRRVYADGVGTLVQFTRLPNGTRHGLTPAQGQCDDHYCVWELDLDGEPGR